MPGMQLSFWRRDWNGISSHAVTIWWRILCKKWNSLKILSYFDAFNEHTQILLMHEGISMMCNTRMLFGSSVICIARIPEYSTYSIWHVQFCPTVWLSGAGDVIHNHSISSAQSQEVKLSVTYNLQARYPCISNNSKRYPKNIVHTHDLSTQHLLLSP